MEEKRSCRIPISRLIIFYIFSSGLYLFYWFYRNWSQLKEHHNIENVKPKWLTLGLIIPLYNYYLIYDLLNQIKQYSSNDNITLRLSPALITFLLMATHLLPTVLFIFVVPQMSLLYPMAYYVVDTVIYLLGLLAVVYAQVQTNRYWLTVEKESLKYKKVTWPEVVILFAGLLLLVVNLISSFGN